MHRTGSQDPGWPTQAASGAATQVAAAASILPKTHEIDRLVASVIATWNGRSPLLQKRRWQRILYDKPVVLTPLDEISGATKGESMLAHGHDISLGGISFTHSTPLPYRLIAVTLPRGDGRSESVVTRLTWCRFTLDGVYRSGGKFLRKGDVFPVPESDWDALPTA
jgi:hypothetical protein